MVLSVKAAVSDNDAWKGQNQWPGMGGGEE